MRQFVLLFTSLQNDLLHSEEKLFVMEFKRDRVIALYLAGKPQVAFVRAIQHLNVNKSLVSRAIAHCCDTGSIASPPKCGRKKR